MIDITIISYIILLIFAVILAIEIVSLKYMKALNITYKDVLKNTTILSKITWIVVVVFLIALLLVSVVSIVNQDSIPYSSGQIYDTLIVDDGVVVVGGTTTEIQDGNSHHIGGEAFIAKYDMNGTMLFENVYISDDEAQCTVNMFYKVTELDGYYYASNGSDCIVQFDQSGNIIDAFLDTTESNSIQTSQGLLSYTRTYNEGEYTFTIEFTLNEVTSSFTYDPVQNFQGDMDVYLLGETEDSVVVSIILGEFPYSVYQPEGYNYLLEIDLSTRTIAVLMETDEYRCKDLITIGSKNYILSNNLYTRTTLLLEIDDAYEIIGETQIKADKDYFVLVDWFVEDDQFFFIGNEYETMTKEGFTEYFTGVVNVYDFNLEYKRTIRLPLGVQVLSIERQEDLFYIGGRFNTTIGASFLSDKQDYPWCGMYLVFDYKTQKTISYDYINKQYVVISD